MKIFILEQIIDTHLILPFSKDEGTLYTNEVGVLAHIKS